MARGERPPFEVTGQRPMTNEMNHPLTVTSRGVTVRDFAIFQVKLLLDGGKDLVAFWLSIVAITLDFIAGRGRRPRLFYSVVRASERFDRWINLHSVLEEMGERDDGEGLLGAASADDTFLDEIERLVRGGEKDREKALRRLRERGGELKKKGGEISRRVLDDEGGPGDTA